MTKVVIRQLPTKAVCIGLKTKFDDTKEVCGWRPKSYIEGVKTIKCLDCGGVIEIPEEMNK